MGIPTVFAGMPPKMGGGGEALCKTSPPAPLKAMSGAKISATETGGYF